MSGVQAGLFGVGQVGCDIQNTSGLLAQDVVLDHASAPLSVPGSGVGVVEWGVAGLVLLQEAGCLLLKVVVMLACLVDWGGAWVGDRDLA
eukprot:6846206-Alexandrium_andersonii.AAC.1